MQKRQAIYMGSFTAALMSARDAATSDLRHKLADASATLPFWQRHWKAVMAWVFAVIAAVAGAYLIKILGLSS
jgi:hypothetical protein